MAVEPKIRKEASKIAKTLDDLIDQELLNKLTSNVEEVKELIIETYDQELINVVTSSDSKTRPEDYLDDFMEKLEEFEYIEEVNDQLIFRVPDMENFDFSGRLRVIENILEGIVGTYVEITGGQWLQIFGKSKVPTDPIDSSVPVKERVYLLKYNAFIKGKEKELNVKFVRYPFSNAGPMDIFDDVNRYVSDEISKWIDEAVSNAQTRLSEEY